MNTEDISRYTLIAVLISIGISLGAGLTYPIPAFWVIFLGALVGALAMVYEGVSMGVHDG